MVASLDYLLFNIIFKIIFLIKRDLLFYAMFYYCPVSTTEFNYSRIVICLRKSEISLEKKMPGQSDVI